MVFTRKADDTLASLVKRIDQTVADNQDKKMASFVSFLGSDAETLKETAKVFGDQHGIQHVALVVPAEYNNGPDSLKLNPDADLTVMLYNNRAVTANHAIEQDGLDQVAVDAIIADAQSLVH